MGFTDFAIADVSAAFERMRPQGITDLDGASVSMIRTVFEANKVWFTQWINDCLGHRRASRVGLVRIFVGKRVRIHR